MPSANSLRVPARLKKIMAEEENQPRKIKDLKARLGRTIAPSTMTGPVAPPGGPVQPPPGIAPPSFLAPKKDEEDPFAASAAAQQAATTQVVFDESAAEELREKHTQERTRAVILTAAVTALIAIGIGYVIGGVASQRDRFKSAIATSEEIYQAVDAAQAPLDEAYELISRITRKAAEHEIDFEALEKLRAMPNPFQAEAFAGKDYLLFNPQAVDSLFAFNREAAAVFNQISRFAQNALSANGRARLEASVEADKNMKAARDSAFAKGFGWMEHQVGCRPHTQGPVPRCELVYVDNPPLNEAGNEVTSTTVKAGPNPRSRPYEGKLYTGREDLSKKIDDFIILIDNEKSLGVLGEKASAFTEFVREANRIRTALEENVDKERIRAKVELDRIRKEEL